MNGVQNHYYFSSQPTQLAGAGQTQPPSSSPQAAEQGTPGLLWAGWAAFIAALALPITAVGDRAFSGGIYAYAVLTRACDELAAAYNEALVFGVEGVHLDWELVARAAAILIVAAAPLLWQARASRRAIGLLMVPLTVLVASGWFATLDGAGYYATVASWLAVTVCFLRGR